MIVFREAPFPDGTARLTISAGDGLDDALAQIQQSEDCIGCAATVAAPGWAPPESIERVRRALSPLADAGPVIRPDSAAGGLLRRGGYWTEVDIDAGAQRLRSVKLPSDLMSAQRLFAINDLRGDPSIRPIVAIGLWALFAHPVVRMSARAAGQRDGLTAEIALAVHPDRYVAIESDSKHGLTFVATSADPIAMDLIVLAMRQNRVSARGAGPWEDPLVQAATELDLGARTYEELEIDAILSPALSSQQQELAATTMTAAAELIGVRPTR